jgi:hypothetical protein
MPNNQIKHDAEKTGRSKESLEKDWKDAEGKVKDEYGTDDDHWGVVQKIYQNKKKAHSSVVESAIPRILEDQGG